MRYGWIAFLFFSVIISCSHPRTQKSIHTQTDASTGTGNNTRSESDTLSSVSSATAVTETGNKATSTGNLGLSIYKNEGEAGGYGYDIADGDKKIIHQPHIPAVSGTKGFLTYSDAEKAGKLMMYKIQQGIMPPTVSISELDSLKITY